MTADQIFLNACHLVAVEKSADLRRVQCELIIPFAPLLAVV